MPSLRSQARLASLAGTLTLFLASCGSTSGTASTPSGSPSVTPSPTLTTTVAPIQAGFCTPAGANPGLALVGTAAGPDTTVYSLKDPTSPASVCTLSKAGRPKFVSASAVSYVNIPNFTPATSSTDYVSNIILFDLKTGQNRLVATATGNVWDFAWSPDATILAYDLQTAAGHQLWSKRGDAAPQAITAVLPSPGRDIVTGDGVWVRFSPSGRYLIMANTLVTGPHVRVFLTADGSLLWSTVRGGSAFWSGAPERLYFEDFAGEHAWTAPATVSTVSPTGWIDPSQSPDGCCVAYTRASGQAAPYVEVWNLQSATAQALSPALGASPFFTSSSVLWLAQMQKNQGQGLGPSYVPTGIVIAYNLQSQQQFRLAFSSDANNPPAIFDVSVP